MAGLWRTKFFGLRYGAAFGALLPPGGDTTAPTITTGGSFSINENTALAIALTADEAVTWSIAGGPDAAKYEISGTTLRFAGNVTKNFEAPDDADTNNTYIVTVRATDGASNFTDKGITVTILDVAEGGGVDPTIGVPVLSLAVPANTYPPQLNTPLPVDWQAGVTSVRFQSATVANADAGWGTTIIDDLHLITNGEAIAGAWTVPGLSGIITPTVTVFRARAEQGGNVGAWSNELIHGDVTAPSLTSSTAPAAISELVDSLVYTATFNEKVTITGFGGTDGALLEADNPTVPATTFAIRRLDHAVTDYALKTSYSFTITAKDRANNSVTTATITAPVKDEVPTGFVNFYTDQTGVTASTLATAANTYTVAGLTGGVSQPITVSGGEYRVNAGGGYGAWTTAAGTVQNGHLVQVRGTSSSSPGGVVNVIVTIAGTAETFKITTAGTAALPTTGLILQLESDDLTTLFQDVAGTTPVTADGQTVGMWKNKQGDGFNLTAAADNATRPLYKTASGLSWIEFDGVDDILRALSARGAYSAGACTVMVAIRSPASSSGTMYGEGASTGSPGAFYSPMQNSSTDFNDMQATNRTDAGTFPLGGTLLGDETIIANTDLVFITTDSGTFIQGYADGVTKQNATYSRATTTLDRTSIGGNQRSSATNFFLGRIVGVWVWNRVLNSTELAAATSYGGNKQGRVL